MIEENITSEYRRLLNEISKVSIIIQDLFGVTTRIEIINILLAFHNVGITPKKAEIYSGLNDVGYKISYKNVHTNLDFLAKKNYLAFINTDSHIVLVKLNLDKIVKDLDFVNKRLGVFSDLASETKKHSKKLNL